MDIPETLQTGRKFHITAPGAVAADFYPKRHRCKHLDSPEASTTETAYQDSASARR